MLSPRPKRRRSETAQLCSDETAAARNFGELVDSASATSIAIERNDLFRLFVLPSSGAREAQVLALFEHATVLEPFRYRGGKAGKNWQQVIRFHQRLRNYIDGKPTSRLPTPAEIERYGSRLFQVLFPGEVRQLYQHALSVSGANLTLLFTSPISWVADKPWEFSWNPATRRFCALEEAQWLRNAVTALPTTKVPLKRGGLHILVITASPEGLAPLSLGQEVGELKHHLNSPGTCDEITVTVLDHATPERLEESVSRGSFDALHFIGHGYFCSRKNEGGIVLSSSAGAMVRIGCQELAARAAGRGIRMIFINACESGRGGRFEFNRGLAPGLLAAGVPVIVANQFKVLDHSAVLFAGAFYQALALGRTVATAVRLARQAVHQSPTCEPMDWAIPVVYARDPDLKLRP